MYTVARRLGLKQRLILDTGKQTGYERILNMCAAKHVNKQACRHQASSFVRAVASGVAVFQFPVCVDDLISVHA
jgi:hypothetical protein